ncbi:hypothetical protein [Pseudomonas sp. efr-133-TYG-103a]|jgi:hypothetical protein|uniref:hypothetical protein n=1 Tax=Pseudomonas sp. efr-133-TYG-103a TaxID=3040308 RepID=UPI002554AD1E|nr:hypothetical protein [Pseudomonas sp. efr-133-TYG-103a]
MEGSSKKADVTKPALSLDRVLMRERPCFRPRPKALLQGFARRATLCRSKKQHQSSDNYMTAVDGQNDLF